MATAVALTRKTYGSAETLDTSLEDYFRDHLAPERGWSESDIDHAQREIRTIRNAFLRLTERLVLRGALDAEDLRALAGDDPHYPQLLDLRIDP